jgi:hypothetical protein
MMKNSVQNILTIYRGIMLPHAEGVQYREYWGDKFVAENAQSSFDRVKNVKVRFDDLTASEAELLGFPLWDESGMRLVPLWLYDHLEVGQPLVCIDGETKVVTENYKQSGHPDYMDNDHRGGATAWGFMPCDIEEAAK